MGRFSRQELENAFEHYQDVSRQAGESGDWSIWADQFTEDAIWVEHQLPEPVQGREAMRAVIVKGMQEPFMDQMKYFPIEWYMIDDDRGWVACVVWNRMTD